MRIFLPGRPWGLSIFLASLRVLPSFCFVSHEGGPLGDISSLYSEGGSIVPEIMNGDGLALNAFVEVDGFDLEDGVIYNEDFPYIEDAKPSLTTERDQQRSIQLHSQTNVARPATDYTNQSTSAMALEPESPSTGNKNSPSQSFLRGHKTYNGRPATIQMSALQMKEQGSILQGIGGALLGSAAGTLLGGANQALQGPFALNTPQTNLTAGLTQTPVATAVAAPPLGATPVAGMAAVPGAAYAPYDTSADNSHTVAGVVIGVIVGLILLCLIGGCVWKMTKKKR